MAQSTVSKIVSKVEPLTSEDFEIKPPPSKRKHLDLPPLPTLSPDKTERWLILPDMQIPYHDEDSLVAVLNYAKTQVWDGCIQLGDFMDWDWCSRWTKENQRAAEGSRFVAEYMMGNDVLDAIQYAVRKRNPNCRMVILEGNHDWRVENVVDITPALEGLIEMEKGLRLAEREITYWKYWTHWQNWCYW